jgi:hypothetical protein
VEHQPPHRRTARQEELSAWFAPAESGSLAGLAEMNAHIL